MFCAIPELSKQATGRIKHNFRRIDGNDGNDGNDDKIVNSLADNTFEAEAFRWDTI